MAAPYVTACDVAKAIPGEDAQNPMRQSVMQVISVHNAKPNSTDSAQAAVLYSPNNINCTPTVRQNAAASFPVHSAVLSHHSSPLHLQTSEKQQVPKPELHASRAVHFNQQGKVLQQQPNSSTLPKQQPQDSPTTCSAWARKEYVSFGDIDLSTSAHI
ncbi:hypothetical protein AXF42_Ash021634 [Apostasia shenzhenica]|uniref:Uncharacterized protein n=1 Tax=Apostasia shenzhenica TaxID=1088818 RepID=A0A2H9ZST8_9ASPA|nr:hypothetical protein AXF42_Ash021634 [Apostasia shenzhenica]